MPAPRNAPLLSCHESTNGCEYYIAVHGEEKSDFQATLNALLATYTAFSKEIRLDEESEIYLHFFLSDITNQAPLLRRQLQGRAKNTFLALRGQAPAHSGVRVSLEAYHIKGEPGLQKKADNNHLLLEHNGYQSMWSICRPDRERTAAGQTREIFQQLTSRLQDHNASLARDVMRTWLFVRDIDNNYEAMVQKRRQLFAAHNLTPQSHFIASTGIDAANEEHHHLVQMETLTILGLQPGQVSHLHAPEQMCATSAYNVTFERGTRITFGDRSHFHISGTASIDRAGQVVHPGNVVKQTERTLENIEALLRPCNASLSDLKNLIVYVRDACDAALVAEVLHKNLTDRTTPIPITLVRAAVCRPAWLVEIEGIAVSDAHNRAFKAFC